MTKKQLLDKMHVLLGAKGMIKIDAGNGAIGWNDRKDSIQNAIDCLEASDEEMNDYLTVIKLKYPNIWRTVTNNGDWLTHYHNRLWVYNSARMALA